MEVKGKNVFISGPMTGMPDLNVGVFAVAHHRLKEMGAADVYNPSTEYLDSERTDKMAHSDWMRVCLHELTAYLSVYAGRKYDALLSLPGWEQSEGARLERMVAEAIGMEIIEAEEIGL